MNNNYQQAHYTMHRNLHSGEEEQYDTGGHSQSFQYAVSGPPVTWPATSMPTAFYSAPQSNDAYSYANATMLPHPSYGAGASTDPSYYHHNRNSLVPFPYTSSEMNSPTWPQTSGVSGYEVTYANGYGDAGSPTGSCETRDISPPSESGTIQPGMKEKKFVCRRISLTSPTTTCNKGFARKADLQRHEGCVHDGHTKEKEDCPFKKCQRKGENGFKRRDHLTEHLRHFHHKDIPKRQRRGDVEGSVEDEEEVQHEDGTHQQQYANAGEYAY